MAGDFVVDESSPIKPLARLSRTLAMAAAALGRMTIAAQGATDAFDSTSFGLQSAKAVLRKSRGVSRAWMQGSARPAGTKLARRASKGSVGKAVLR